MPGERTCSLDNLITSSTRYMQAVGTGKEFSHRNKNEQEGTRILGLHLITPDYAQIVGSWILTSHQPPRSPPDDYAQQRSTRCRWCTLFYTPLHTGKSCLSLFAETLLYPCFWNNSSSRTGTGTWQSDIWDKSCWHRCVNSLMIEVVSQMYAFSHDITDTDVVLVSFLRENAGLSLPRTCACSSGACAGTCAVGAGRAWSETL